MTEKIWIAGDGRSGSTWLANLINYQSRLRFLFEPFHPKNEPGMAPFGSFPYIRPGASAPDFEAYVRSVFNLQFQSEWSARFATGSSYDGVLVKCIFSNLFLGWADRILPDVRKVLLLRHPCAVAHSKQVLSAEGWGWETQAARFWERTELREDYLLPHESLIKEAMIKQVDNDPYLHYVLSWAILNKVPLQQLSSDRLYVVHYEQLCLQPEKELPRLFRYLGHPDPDSVWPDSARQDETVRFWFDAVSQTSRRISTEERIAGWTKHVPPEAVTCAMEILAAFGLDSLYGRDLLPIRASEERR